jgi:glyoxylase-like metal-dependent hydrolase (beta-lactamase superfamily II)
MNQKLVLGLAASAIFLASPLSAQRDFSEVEITSEELAPGVAVLFGAGGNMAVSHGEDGTILNVRVRMSSEQTRGDRVTPPSPKAALPVVTYERGVTLHLNGDTIDVLFVGGGHTDGDSIVRWREKNIVHMGDLYFKIPGWPFVDVASGGDIESLLFSLDSAIKLMDDDTKVIPGHGAMSNRAELIAYRNTIGEAVTRIRALRDTGSSLEEVQAAKPLDSFERGEGFIDADGFIAAVWNSLD